MTLFLTILRLLRTWLTRTWFLFRGPEAPAVVPSDKEAAPVPPPALVALPPSLPATAPPSLTSTDDDSRAQVASHLEFYGYAIRHEPHGWSYVHHPDRRYNFHVRVSPRGMRLDCRVGIGASIGSSRLAWLDFVNGANGRSSITRFALDEDESGTYVRMRAMVPGPYNRPAFAMVMDMWHDDLDIVMRKPDFIEQGSDGDVEETVLPPVIVN
jgi:hypothetical protein